MSRVLEIEPPKCKAETIIRLSKKYLEPAALNPEPQTPEELKALLDRLVDYMGGMLHAYDSTVKAMEMDQDFQEPESYDLWDRDEPITQEQRDEVTRYLGMRDAVKFVSDRHAIVANDFMLMIAGR